MTCSVSLSVHLHDISLQVYLDDTPDHAVQESVAAYSDLQEGEDFDSEWVDGAVINTYHQDAGKHTHKTSSKPTSMAAYLRASILQGTHTP